MPDVSGRQRALLAVLPEDRPIFLVDLLSTPQVAQLYRGRRVRTLAGDVAELAARGLVEVTEEGVRRCGEPAEWREQQWQEIREAMGKLDGTRKARVVLRTELSPERLDELGWDDDVDGQPAYPRRVSIYATTWTVADDEHDDGCAARVDDGMVWSIDPNRPCTCQAGPIAYQASHVLPGSADRRAGCFQVAAIPGFIAGPGRPALHDGEGEDWPYHPYLRVSLDPEDVVLTRDQVAGLHAELGRWLGHTSD